MTSKSNAVSILQWNTRKQNLSVDELRRLSKTDNQPIFLITEPKVTRKTQTIDWGILGYEMCFTKRKPFLTRSCIICPKNIPKTHLGKLSDNDHAVVILETEPKIGIISAYLDINYKNIISPTMQNAVDYFKNLNIEYLICCDSNASSTLWESVETCARGDQIEEFILNEGLVVANAGNKYTWSARGSTSIIDITLQSKPDMVSDWQVGHNILSDHEPITYTLNLVDTNEVTTTGRHYQRADWTKFKNILNQTQEYPAKIWNKQTIELAVTDLYREINLALDEVAPLKEIKLKETLKWWNGNIENERRKCDKLYKKFMKGKVTAETKESVDAAYKTLCTKAQRSSFKDFCSKQENVKAVSKLNNMVKGTGRRSFEQVKLNGKTSQSSLQTLEILMETHFGSDETRPPEKVKGRSLREKEVTLKWITVKTIKHHFHSFGPLKMVGPGDFKPIVLQNLPNSTLEALRKIFTACIQLAYTPNVWKRSAINWIPKVGKEDYSNPRNFRPITLSSFLLKCIEKHISVQIEPNLKLSKIQHGFVKRKGTDTALAEVNDKIEQGTLFGQYTMAVSIDQRGCFDNIDLEYARKQWENKKIPENIINWYFELMNNRTIHTSLNGQTVEKQLGRGVGQGLVLSSTCWNLCFDPILRKMQQDDHGITVVAYADDAIIMATGCDPSTLRDKIQKTIKNFVQWGHESGLTFSHEKTEAVIFHPKHAKNNWKTLKKLKVEGIEVPYSDSLKYLGVTFRRDMNWTPYALERIKKSKNLMFMQRNIVGKTWGVNPKLSKWLYTGIVRPTLSYAAHIWSHRVTDTVNKKLKQMQRLSMLLVAGIEKSTPTSTIQILYNILPIDLFLKERAIITSLRITGLTRNIWAGLGNSGKLSTKLHWSRVIRSYNLDYKTDKTSIKTKDKEYSLIPFNKNADMTEKEDIIYVYSDGSKLEGNVGFGGVIRENGNTKSEFLGRMSPFNSVYQAEVKGITEGAIILKNNNIENKTIVFRVDNQAALISLNKNIIVSKAVYRCYIELKKLCNNNNITLEWVKAHSSVTPTGNDIADKNAKQGTKSDVLHENVLPPQAHLRTRIKTTIRNEWQSAWNSHAISGPVTQSRRLIGGPRNDITSLIDQSDRNTVRNMVAIITGHGPNLHNQVNKGFAQINMCRLCLECDDETSWHILCECPSLNEWRFQTLGFHNCNADALHDWDPRNLKKFLRAEAMEDIRYPPYIQRHPP